MKIFVVIGKNKIILRARAVGHGIIGDMVHELRPGEKFLGVDYDTFKEHGAGEILIENKKIIAKSTRRMKKWQRRTENLKTKADWDGFTDFMASMLDVDRLLCMRCELSNNDGTCRTYPSKIPESILISSENCTCFAEVKGCN